MHPIAGPRAESDAILAASVQKTGRSVMRESKKTGTVLSWARQDIEQRFLFRGRRHLQVNNILCCLLGAMLTVGFYASLLLCEGTMLSDMFTQRGPTPYVIAFLGFWSIAILFIKSRKLALQRRSLLCEVAPADYDFVLSSATVDQVLEQIHSTVDDARHFVLFNRIVVALSNLRNLGRVTDVGDILRNQSEADESAIETSYSVLAGFVWAIPVLGFVGTVLGLSAAMGDFGSVLESTGDMSQIKAALSDVTGGLSTAFDTTLVGLVAALAIQLIITFQKKAEQEFVDECSEYCSRHIVNRLRIMPFEAGTTSSGSSGMH